MLNAIGVTDKEGDAPNLSGESARSLIDCSERTAPITTDLQVYNGADVSVGGRFDAAEDYVDFVAHVVKDGGFGVTEFRLDRDPVVSSTPPKTSHSLKAS